MKSCFIITAKLLILLSLTSCGFLEKTRSKVSDIDQAQTEVLSQIASSVPVSVQASELGYASSSIGIDALPAGNGFVPKLGLTYSSSVAEASLAGVGWNLSGLSVISRCPSHEAFEGTSKAINWSNQDAYCYDGKKLLLISGESGSAGAEYRLYLDEGKKIVFTGDHFEVTSRAGEKLFFGQREESRANGLEGTYFSYQLDKITDRSGNVIDFAYEKEGNRLYVSKVSYGGNEVFQKPAYRFISFNYEKASESSVKYIAGQAFTGERILKSVEVGSEEGNAWTYKLGYELKGQAQTPLLTSVEQCFQNKVCTPKTTFGYDYEKDIRLEEQSKLSWTEFASKVNVEWANNKTARAYIDLNNDGFIDLLALKKDRITYSLNGPNGMSAPVNQPRTDLAMWSPLVDMFSLADVNRDGFQDIILYTQYGDNPGVYVAYWTGSGFSDFQFAGKGFGRGWSISLHLRAVVDVNNDGWPDLIGSKNEGIFVAFNDKQGHFVGGETPIAEIFTLKEGWMNRDFPRYFLDVNGDSIPDVLGMFKKDTYVALGTGKGFLKPTVWVNSFGRDNYSPISMPREFADMNGDGLTDMVVFAENGVEVSLNNGKSFLPPTMWLKNLGYNQKWADRKRQRMIFDVNQDGFPDFVGFDRFEGLIFLGKGEPIGDAEPIKMPNFGTLLFNWNTTVDHVQMEDLNGNGKTDFFTTLPEGVWRAELNGKRIKLTSIKSGLGEETVLSYSSIMDSNVYKKTKDALENTVSVVGSLEVVSEIKHSNGLGGYTSTKYRYEDALYHRDIYGFLGFAKRTITDTASGIETVENYSQDTEKMTQGVITSSENHVIGPENKLIARTTTSWEAKTLPGHELHRQIKEQGSKTENFDETGKFSYSTLVEKEFDEYLNPKLIRTTNKDDKGTYVTEVRIVFVNNPTLWLFGAPKDVTSVSTVDGGLKVMKHSIFEYDGNGLLYSETEEPESPLWRKKVYERRKNSFGLVDTTMLSWGPEHSKGLSSTSLVVSSELDERGFLKDTTNALGQKVSQLVDPISGNVTSSYDLNSLETKYSYGSDFRLESVTSPDGVVTESKRTLCDAACPPNAVLVETKSAKGLGFETSYFDVLGRVVRTERSLYSDKVSVAENSYDEKGRLKSASVPYFKGDKATLWVSYGYDDRGRVNSVKRPDGFEEKVRFNGLQTSKVDALGHETVFENDARGLLRSTANALGETISYLYDGAGQLREMTDPEKNVTKFDYDVFGRRTLLQDKAVGETNAVYNALDQVGRELRAGVPSVYTYDLLGRMLTKVTGSGDKALAESYVYDTAAHGVGMLSTVKGKNSERSLSYDALSRPEFINHTLFGKSYQEQIGYDSLGRPSTKVYPNGFTAKFNFDDVGSPSDIRDEKSGRVLWQLSEQYPTGATKTVKLGNGATVNTQIDLSSGYVTAETTTGLDQTLQIARSYVPDANGNLVERKDSVTGVSESFLYDKLDRLENLSAAGKAPIWIKYEGVNRIKSRDDVGSYEYGPSCAGSIQSPFIPKKIGQKSYCADGRGNIIKAGEKSITYDLSNMPTDMIEGQDRVHYEYGFGRTTLSKEEVRGGDKTLTRFVGDSFEVEESSIGVKEKAYVGDFLIIETEGNEYRENYLYKDFLGSTLAVADQTGAVTERLDYDPFGQRRDSKDLTWLDGFKPKTTSHGFTGHDHIDSMNLIHMKGRVYDPTIGLFLSPDPYIQDPTLVQNLNRYSYVLNNPLSYTDPSGHFFKKLGKQISKGLKSAGKAIQNPGSFLQNTWNKSSRAATDPRYIRMAASIAISVVATAYCPYTAPSMWAQSAAYYAAVGATSSYMSSGGDMKAAVYGAATASAFNLVGSAFEYAKVGADGQKAKDLSTGMAIGKVAAHGVVAGLSSQANGESFESGFWSGALSQSAGRLYGAMGASDNAQGWGIAYNAAVSGVVGGTISEVSGGSFEQGALNAAMGRLFNDVYHGNPASYDERIPVLDDGGTEDYDLKMSRQYGSPRIYAIPMDSPEGLSESFFPELDKMASCAPGVMCSTVPLIGPRGSWTLTESASSDVMTHARFGKFYKSSSDGLWWAKDLDGHGGSAFKVFKADSKGLNWFKDADQYGDFIAGKHKGPTGINIPYSQFKKR